MSFADWDPEEVEEVQRGLLLVGWRADHRLTSDDAMLVRKVALEALDLSANDALDPDSEDRLALDAYDIMWPQLMDPGERALMVSGPYGQSNWLRWSRPLVDEATLCFYRGYHTAALAALFIVLETYLRQLSGWQPGSPDPSFRDLRRAVLLHPPSSARDEAEGVLAAVYRRYDAAAPAQFYFNRHGLLHGLRGPQGVDEMNCVRLLLLLDLLCAAEDVPRILLHDEASSRRFAAYSACTLAGADRALLDFDAAAT